ncbi:HK97 gp10 family phage protein [Xenorhabdus sp. 12]|uniref:HK97 gp10 family phage protein n=1 Tax=Xenorhabdus santafensis TaxID=2582833 RepID=A0ABU4S7G2_9GAMM|nr:HK97 gp10 family phage protein [Xenorhabdus sp. 12]MDX7985986.1 HK97 gp10 family phage protein [Xenorhabdus sp. 12]
MAARVRGIREAKASLAKIVGDIKSNKVTRAMHRALDIGGRQAAVYTPIDTKTLINSNFREVSVNGTMFTGRVGYSASYAVFVHDPRIAQKFKRPTAKKEFLKAGFEETKAMIDAAIAEEMRL